MAATIKLCLRWRCFTSWIRMQIMHRRLPCSPFQTLDSSSFPHLRGGYLVVNVLCFCTFRDQTSNLSNFHLLRAHGTLSCFCLLFFLARMPSILLLNTCSSIRSRRQCRLSHDGFPPGGEWSLAPCDVRSLLCCQSMQNVHCRCFLLCLSLAPQAFWS